jgi:hypothetical protein
MIKTKKTRHAWPIFAVYCDDKKIGHIMREVNREGYQYTPARKLGNQYIAISGNDRAFTFDEALKRLEDSYLLALEAFKI